MMKKIKLQNKYEEDLKMLRQCISIVLLPKFKYNG
jgi:hypothetical protein